MWHDLFMLIFIFRLINQFSYKENQCLTSRYLFSSKVSRVVEVNVGVPAL